MFRAWLIVNVCVAVCVWPGPGVRRAQAQEATPDPFMGDWKGTLRGEDNKESPICAQVICWGNGDYQANLIEAFDQRAEPIAVLQGKLTEGKVVFDGDTAIGDDQFAGKVTGKKTGSFTMKHVVRLSPTLGEKAPAGAIVLFDGKGLEEWQDLGSKSWIVDLAKAVGGSHRTVYLRSRVWSPKAQPATLELGSDDAIRAWLNGELIHSNNVSRGCTPWEDKANIALKEGWNEVKLKVIQGEGDWAACARVRSREGKDLDGLKFEPAPKLKEGQDMKSVQGESSGTIVAWELAGPYMEEGKQAGDLFDAAFAPERDGAGVEWRTVNDQPAESHRWKLVGGAMEVTPGARDILCKRKFGDHRIHLEFRSPFMPTARGQGRGNSGVYVQGRYEVQVLDSYGLKGEINECGAIYSVAAPRVNVCAPPMQWQTYDIEFHTARAGADGKKAAEANITVRHNGVLVHDHQPLPGGSPGDTGGILFQDHGNAVQYRNVWVVELKPEAQN